MGETEKGQATKRISEGHLDVKAEVKSKDEIGDLAKSFNKMTGDLSVSMQREKELTAAAEAAADAEKKRSEELRSVNQQLKASEQQQKAANQQLRASEQQLKASNQQLAAKEQALRSSQEELRNKVVDLERFNRLMVGRELKMIELKREVNSLLEELGRPKEYEAPDRIATAEGVGD